MCSCESRNPGPRALGPESWAPACAGARDLLCKENSQTKMGAGIAADPLSPDFDPLIRLPRKTNRAVWLRRPTPPRAANGAKALCFGHRGRARYSCEPQRHGLDGQLGVPDRNPFRFASATTCRTAFRPVMSVAHPAITANTLPRSRGRGGMPRSAIPASVTPTLARPHIPAISNLRACLPKRAGSCDPRLFLDISF